MPRSNWKGNITFGMVLIPISLFNSIEPTSRVSFKQINKKTGSPIKYKRIDLTTEKEVAWDDIGKGYAFDKDTILPVEEEELKKVAGVNARTIAIEEFVDKKNISFIDIENTYYLVPDKKGEKGYVILREALKDSNKIGIAKVIISTREYLSAVAVYKNALVLHLLHYADEVRDLSEFNIPSENIKDYKVSAAEINIAKKLINSTTSKWRPTKYKDDYKEAVEKWVAEKIHHLPTTKMKPRTSAKNANIVDFVDLLKQSLHQSKAHASKKTRKAKHVPKATVHHPKRIHH